MDELFLPCGWPQGVCTGSAGVANAAPDVVEAAEAEAAFILWTLTGQRFGQCEVQVSLAPECRCRFRCRCDRCILYLPGYAGAVSEVLVNGEVFTDYTQRKNQLIKINGWPSDVTVTYLRGRPVPPGGERSVRLLATQLVRSWCPDGDCGSGPPNKTQQTRQGVTVTYDPKQTGRTGLPMVDSWIDAVNRVGNAPSVWSPDTDKWVYESGPTPV